MLDSTIIGVADYSKVGEEHGCKKVTSLAVSVRGFYVITEGTMIGIIEVSLECSPLATFEWAFEGLKEQPWL